MSFLLSAGRKTTDIRAFLREAADNSGLRYRAEKGKKHYIHIPCVPVEEVDEQGNVKVVNQIVAQFGMVHDWEDKSGKYTCTVCLKDVVRRSEDGTLLNDGSCPICKRSDDGWAIYNYRYDMEKESCGLEGAELEKYMEGVKSPNGKIEKHGKKRELLDERLAKEARPYLYILIVLYRTDGNDAVIIDKDGIPEYDLKVMKMSSFRVEKIQKQIENSGLSFAGGDLVIEYSKDPANDMLLVSQSTISPIFPAASITNGVDNANNLRYPGLREAIQADVNKFKWEGLEKSFREWEGMTNAEAERVMNETFKSWDSYQLELATNPNAKYLEYAPKNKAATNPELTMGASQIPTGTPKLQEAGQGATTGLGNGGGGVALGNANIPDANAVFGSGGNTIKI